jgi:hypothetical protein
MILTDKAKQEFEKWLKQQQNIIFNKYTKAFVFMGKLVFYDLPETVQFLYISEWFDTIGITVDIIPRMSDENKIVFEPNTFCLKHEIVTEDFIRFETRQEAVYEAIKKANEIYNSI